MRNYYFSINNQKNGPFDETAIKTLISDGKINKESLAWREGMSGWQPIGQISELISSFGSLFTTPPPLPANVQTPPPLPQNAGQSAQPNLPAGLDAMNAAAYRFVAWGFRPWRGRSNVVFDYVQKDPKRALPVTVLTIGLMAAIIFGMANMNVNKQQVSQNPGAQQQVPQQGTATDMGALMAQQRAMQDAHNFTMQTIDDVYEYKRDAGDRMDETYKRANYDWYRDNDN
jgi:hypothetical protein